MDVVRFTVDKLDGSELASFALDPSTSIWDLKTQIDKKLGISPDRQRLIRKCSILSAGDTLRYSGIRDGDRLQIVIAPPSHFVIAGYKDRCARLWVVETGECYTFDGHQERLRAATASPDGSKVATASDDGTVKIWDAKSGECVNTFDSGNGPVCCAAFSPHSDYLATGSSDGTAIVWSVEKGAQYIRADRNSTYVWVARHSDTVQSIAWSSACDRVAIAAGNAAFLWSASLPTYRTNSFRGHTGPIKVVSLSAGGHAALTASADNDVRLWDVAHGLCTHRFEHHGSPLAFAAFSADGRRILTALGSHCVLLEAATGKRVRVFAGHDDPINWCEFSSDGAVAVTASDDGSVRLWDVDEGDCVQTFRCQHRRAAISASICG